MASFTRKAIEEAFLKLLDARPLNQITVKDIVEECGVNRNTFYYHFQDIPTLIKDIFTERAEALLKQRPDYASLEDALDEAVQMVIKSKRIVYHLYRSAHRDELERYVSRLSMEVMRRYLAELSRGRDVKPDDFEMICQFYKSALYGLVMEWLERGMQDDPERIVRRIGELFDGGLMHAITVSEQS